MKRRCRYFEDYGDEGHKGRCEKPATLALPQYGTDGRLFELPIQVCDEHANRIVSRFPELGSVAERFVSIDKLDEFGRLDVLAVLPSGVAQRYALTSDEVKEALQLGRDERRQAEQSKVKR